MAAKASTKLKIGQAVGETAAGQERRRKQERKRENRNFVIWVFAVPGAVLVLIYLGWYLKIWG